MSCSFNSVTRCLSILLTSDNNITGAGHSRRSLGRQAGLGDAQGGDVEELLEADIAAALDTEAALLHAAEDLSHREQVLSGGERRWVAAGWRTVPGPPPGWALTPRTPDWMRAASSAPFSRSFVQTWAFHSGHWCYCAPITARASEIS